MVILLTSDPTNLGATSWTVVFACLKPLVHTAFVESMFAIKQTQIVFWHIVIEADEALDICQLRVEYREYLLNSPAPCSSMRLCRPFRTALRPGL